MSNLAIPPRATAARPHPRVHPSFRRYMVVRVDAADVAAPRYLASHQTKVRLSVRAKSPPSPFVNSGRRLNTSSLSRWRSIGSKPRFIGYRKLAMTRWSRARRSWRCSSTKPAEWTGGVPPSSACLPALATALSACLWDPAAILADCPLALCCNPDTVRQQAMPQLHHATRISVFCFPSGCHVGRRIG